MTKSRILTAIAFGSAVVLGASACSAGAGDDQSASSLDVWIMEGTNPESEEFFTEVASAFEAQTGAQLNVEFVQWADAQDRFLTAIAGGTTPDVAETGTTWTSQFADAGALTPIGPMVDEAGVREDLNPGLLEAGTYEAELYGMPWYAGVRSLVYRADLFDEHGIEPPTTWDEIVEAGNTLAEEEPDIAPFAVAGDAEFPVYPWVWGAGGEVATQGPDGTWTSGLNSPEAIEGVEFYTGLATEHDFSTAGATTWKETDLLDAFSQGSVGMALMGSWTTGTVVENNPELDGDIAAIPIPGRDGGISPSVVGGSHLSMFETAEDPDLGWAFIELMTTGEFAEEWAAQSGYFPGQTSLLDSATSSDDALVAPFATQFVDGGKSLPAAPTYGAVQAEQSTNAAIQSILSGQSSVSDAMNQAAEEMTVTLNGQ